MTTQSEYALEQALIAQLKGMEYEFVGIDTDTDMRIKSMAKKLHGKNTEYGGFMSHVIIPA